MPLVYKCTSSQVGKNTSSWTSQLRIVAASHLENLSLYSCNWQPIVQPSHIAVHSQGIWFLVRVRGGFHSYARNAMLRICTRKNLRCVACVAYVNGNSPLLLRRPKCSGLRVKITVRGSVSNNSISRTSSLHACTPRVTVYRVRP